MPRKIPTDTLFALRMLMEMYRRGQNHLDWVLLDLEKTNEGRTAVLYEEEEHDGDVCR